MSTLSFVRSGRKGGRGGIFGHDRDGVCNDDGLMGIIFENPPPLPPSSLIGPHSNCPPWILQFPVSVSLSVPTVRYQLD